MNKPILIAALLIIAVSLPACHSVKRVSVSLNADKPARVKPRKHGPPPHAPAHGYRYKHEHGVELKFDNTLGAYVILEIPRLYFYDSLYIRLQGDIWQVSTHFDGPWRSARHKEVPSKLRKAKGKDKEKEHPGRGRGKRER